MYHRFGLVLMVNHACNLRCTYCYTGDKAHRPMSRAVGEHAINRAIASLTPGGVLELGFFGGEPLIESSLILCLLDHASRAASARGVELRATLTTNGTIDAPAAWRVMLHLDVELTLSHDGLPETHDRHRLTPTGGLTSHLVEATMRKLRDAGKTFGVNVVVRPDTLEDLPLGVYRLLQHGVRRVDLSLDLWTRWTTADAPALEEAIARCADVWHAALPSVDINWFSEKAAAMAGVPVEASARCGFGDGEIAVAPSGNLYPCERLIGEDAADNPMRLPGHALRGDDFLAGRRASRRSHPSCDACDIESSCGTTCACSNYVRTGDPSAPDRLLCLLNELAARHTHRVATRFVPLRVNLAQEVLT